MWKIVNKIFRKNWLFINNLNFRTIDIFNFIIGHVLNPKYYLVDDTKRDKFTKDWLDIVH
jgi:hypothetical protein